MSSRQSGQDISELVEMSIPKGDAYFGQPTTTEELRNILPVAIVHSDVDCPPPCPKLRQFNVLGSFVVALLTVTFDAHGLVIPVRVRALLALGDDVVTIHQNQPTLLPLTEKVNVDATTVVLPSDEFVTNPTTTDTLASVNSERLEI